MVAALAPPSPMRRSVTKRVLIDRLESVLGLDIDGDGTVAGIAPITLDEIRKEGGAPLGVTLADVSRTFKRPRVSVASVAPSSAALHVLHKGDEILTINGASVALGSHTAAESLRAASALTLVVIRIPPPPAGRGLLALLARTVHRCAKHQRKWILSNLLAALFLLIAAAQLDGAMRPLTRSLGAIVEQIRLLTAVPPNVHCLRVRPTGNCTLVPSTTGALAVAGMLESEVPSALLPVLSHMTPYLIALSTCPPALSAVLMLVSARLARCPYDRCSRCPKRCSMHCSCCSVSSKSLLLAACLTLLISLVWSLGVAASAILSQHSSTLDVVWARQFSFICSPTDPAMRSVQGAVVEAADAFASAEAALAASVTSRGLTMFKMSAGMVLSDTRRQLAAFTLLCDSLCVWRALDLLSTWRPPTL